MSYFSGATYVSFRFRHFYAFIEATALHSIVLRSSIIMAEQGAEHFMAEWIVVEKTKAGLQHAVVCPNVNVTGRTKERIAQSKRARTGSLALVD